MSRLKETYEQEVKPALAARFNYKNPMQIPKVVKVVVNIGVATPLQTPSFGRSSGGAGADHWPKTAHRESQEIYR